MKTKLLIIVFFISFSGKSQEITVFYKEKRKPAQISRRHAPMDTEHFKVYMDEIKRIKAASIADKDKDSTDIFRQMIQEQANKMSAHSMKIFKETKKKSLDIPAYDFVTVLKIKNENSLYYPQEKVSNDTVSYTRTNKTGREFVDERVNYNNSEIIYINHKKDQKISSLKIYEFDQRGRKFLIEEKLIDLRWTLTKETKKVKQYVCYKAVLNNSDKRVEAWYTKEIIANHGPKGYYGLPGLILELKEGKKTVRFHKIQLLSSDTIDIKPPTEGEKITREELKNLPSKLFNQY